MKNKFERFSRSIINRLEKYGDNAINVDVLTRYELTDEQFQRLSDALTKKYGAKIRLRVLIDPTILGGIELKVRSEILDSSLKTKLNKFINIK
ncbi:F0F1 ATP synthase subunit delta [Ureaplasma sp. ES3154-GEN]|uniref:F0F1 ATP synthase subunit delta n=1 Tax=Ureaplasma sp. ES3154-GEN TaxID=2984844 RepID=UPI0021E8573F|nr:F0F1 ATP synthase subunit delta [Ureaplasma sp. ES3154-GEN]MCV3743385.1 F0F1 ATP synthase subunit delta [Ureaplasma sp. ES3154-GEN]